MKPLINPVLMLIFTTCCASLAQATTKPSTPHLATSIRLTAARGQAKELENLLRSGARIVKRTEPHTLQWLALRAGPNQFRIVDFFADEQGRTAHFSGKVAGALKQQARKIVENGWERGVLGRVEHSTSIASLVRPEAEHRARKASYIPLKAARGQEAALADLLQQAAGIVEREEPGTLLWYALRLNKATFGIFDVFSSEAAREAHFKGAAASALRTSAGRLVEGGWQQGVVDGVVYYDVLSASAPNSGWLTTDEQTRLAAKMSHEIQQLLSQGNTSSNSSATLAKIAIRFDHVRDDYGMSGDIGLDVFADGRLAAQILAEVSRQDDGLVGEFLSIDSIEHDL